MGSHPRSSETLPSAQFVQNSFCAENIRAYTYAGALFSFSNPMLPKLQLESEPISSQHLANRLTGSLAFHPGCLCGILLHTMQPLTGSHQLTQPETPWSSLSATFAQLLVLVP